MIHWNIEDRKQLITLLKDLPDLGTERSRLQILELAGLKQLVPMIDLSGSSFVAVSELVSYLSDYGRLTHDQEALGLLLNTLKGFVGIQQQEFLDGLLTKYDMMTPIAAIPSIDQLERWGNDSRCFRKDYWGEYATSDCFFTARTRRSPISCLYCCQI
jgi:hypothetical protein